MTLLTSFGDGMNVSVEEDIVAQGTHFNHERPKQLFLALLPFPFGRGSKGDGNAADALLGQRSSSFHSR